MTQQQVKIVNAKVVKIDPNKKYLFIIDADSIPKAQLSKLSKGLHDRFGENVFTLSIRKANKIEILEFKK